jgi:VanZ family protein
MPPKLTRTLWFACAAAILVASLLPHSSPLQEQLDKAPDDLLHAACFAVLAFLRPTRREILAAFLLGVAIELIQPYVGRAGELRDVAANCAGLLLGFLLSRLLRFSPFPPL